MRALLSVYRKEGIDELALSLKELGYEILSTGGTANFLREKGIEVQEVSSTTGYPEILGGRVKTLHPVIHGGILYRDWVGEDREDIDKLQIVPIDLVAVNLYPFEDMMKEDLGERELMEFIDIGGPTLIRAAAKNYFRVVVLVDPSDYDWVLDKLKKGTLDEKNRAYLAWKAFSHTAYYDGVISNALKRMFDIEEEPRELSIPMKLGRKLRYGENPHQEGFMYHSPFESLGVLKAQVLQGKEMSFNNYLDADSAAKLTLEFPEDKVCVVVKHNNPCGVAVGESVREAFLKAKETDPESAFGGIVAFNCTVDEETARELTSMFLEVVVAPNYTGEALEILSKKKNLRVLKLAGVQRELDIRKVSGGYLLQDEDTELYKELKVVSKRSPTEEEMEDLLFAWRVCKHTKSNSVVIAKGKRTLAVGSGQVSRVDSLRCAIEKAKRYGFELKGASLASEAFFPFRDSIDIAAREGITAVIHPAGSIRDKEVFQATDEHNLAMVITGMRHFKH